MKKTLLSLLTLVSFSLTYSQGEGSVFTSTGRGVSTTFATDYQALGINPANLGWHKEFKDNRFTLGLFETGFSFTSKLINNENINSVSSFPLNFKLNESRSYTDLASLSSDLQSGITFDFDSRIFGIALTSETLGGFAFSITGRYNMTMDFSKDFADIITYGFGAPYFDSLTVQNGSSVYQVANTPSNFDSLQQDTNSNILAGTSSNPKTIPQLLNGSSMKVSWIREYNFGYGRHIIKNDKFGLYGGIGIKYLEGMALLDVTSNPSNLSGFLSYSPSLISANTPGFLTSGSYKFTFPYAAGKGYGIDLGLNVKAFKRVKIGFAVNDIGSITWKENTYAVSTDSLLSTFRVGGLYKDSSSFQSGTGTASFDSVINNLFEFKQGNVVRKVTLPSTMRLGASIQFGKILELGGELIMPLNSNPGNFRSALYSVGGDLKLGPVRFSSGMVFQNDQVLRVPAGITLVPFGGRYEMGISTRDIRSLIKRRDVEEPMISAAFGFLRFRFL